MNYNKVNWKNGETPINETNLNNMDNGIYEAHAEIQTLESNINTLTQNLSSLESDLEEANANIEGKAELEHTHNYAEVEHQHEQYLTATDLEHNHDEQYASINHEHDYASTSHTHEGFALSTHTHDYAETSHTHTEYATKERVEEVFQSVSNGKQLIASAITDKGVETDANATFQTMADNIASIEVGSGGGTVPPEEEEEGVWEPHPDWINIREGIQEGQLRYLVFDKYFNEGDAYDFRFDVYCTGTIDWGDGTVETFREYDFVHHKYAKGTGKPCSEGYTTFMITVTFTSNGNFSALYERDNPFLWVVHNRNYIHLTNLAYSNNRSDKHPSNVRSYEFLNDSMRFSTMFSGSNSGLFKYHPYLENVYLSFNTTENLKHMDYVFEGCYKLKYISPFSMKNVTSLNKAFRNCKSLKRLPKLDYQNVESAEYILENCFSLEKVESYFNLHNCTNWIGVFRQCFNLKSIDKNCYPKVEVPSGNAMSTFGYCTSLEDIGDNLEYLTKNSSSEVFRNCYSVKNLPASLNTENYNIFSGYTIPYQSSKLERIECLDLSKTTTTSLTNLKNNNYILKYMKIKHNGVNNMPTKIDWSGYDGNERNLVDIDFELAEGINMTASAPQINLDYNPLLSKEVIEKIFNQLPTVEGKTISLRYIPAAKDADKSIAEAKGWTVTL